MREQVVNEWLINLYNIQSKLKTCISQIISQPLLLYYVHLFLVSGRLCFACCLDYYFYTNWE